MADGGDRLIVVKEGGGKGHRIPSIRSLSGSGISIPPAAGRRCRDANRHIAQRPSPTCRHPACRVGPVIPPVAALVRDCPALADQLFRMLEAALVDLNGHSGLALSRAFAAMSVSYGCWQCATA